MARPLILSNGEMHVGINQYGLVHDFYYPYVGLENHTAAKGLRWLVGVWVEGKFSWLNDGSWKTQCTYHPESLVGHTIALHDELGIRIEFDDCVDSTQSAFLRSVHVYNVSEREREIRLFFHQVLVISDSHMSDTVQYLPDEDALLHYKGHRAFIVSATHADGRPMDDYSVGLFGIEGKDGTYRDAEDGELMKNNVEHGRVDSVAALHFTIRSHSSARANYVVAAGKSPREALQINGRVRDNGLIHQLLQTAKWWHEWLKPAKRLAEKLPKDYREPFLRSTMLVKAHQDKRGAVIASTDTEMLNFSRDSYAYCWPRDAAYCMWPLLRIGYTDEVLQFFSFCRRVLNDKGYLAHKYQADGALGSSWHPYVHDDVTGPPIQTDETAIVLFLFGQYYRLHPDTKRLREFYPTLIQPMANFLSSYVDEDGLPKPSYDIWEQKYLTHTYTVSLTYASLNEAVALAEAAGADDDAVRWQSAAEDIHAHRDRFYNAENSYFYKGLLERDGSYTHDDTIDSSSLYGVFMYGLFDFDSAEVKASFETLKQTLVTEEVGVKRYAADDYYRVNAGEANLWPIASLWLAQYAMESNDMALAEKALRWVIAQMSPSGTLPEQLSSDHTPLSVSPLAWSHAELTSALLDMITEPDTEEEEGL